MSTMRWWWTKRCPKATVLSDADKKILSEVRQSCHGLMEKLGELDAYVETLHTELDRRKQP